MASKVLVPTVPFAKLQVKKSPPETSATSSTHGGGFLCSSDAAARVLHLEHSVRFLQEQHRLMLAGLHHEIEALRERNRDLQFQLIFNKDSSPKSTTPPNDENAAVEAKDEKPKRDVATLERDAAAARGEARAAEARALQLQRLVDAQTEKIRELELKSSTCACDPASPAETESRAELRARLADAERLVRRLRGDAERQRRELQCMKNSLQASLRASGLEPGFGFHNSYHFPPVHTSDFWREPLREDYNLMGSRGRNNRRPLTLPELSATGHQIHRSTVYANNHTRPRANGYEGKKKTANNENLNAKTPEDTSDEDKFPYELASADEQPKHEQRRMLPMLTANQPQASEAGRPRARRHHHRKHASTDHT